MHRDFVNLDWSHTLCMLSMIERLQSRHASKNLEGLFQRWISYLLLQNSVVLLPWSSVNLGALGELNIAVESRHGRHESTVIYEGRVQ